MIYWELLWAFFQIGCFSFGGAMGSIPLIRDVVMSYGWVTDEVFTYFVAVSESTPGPIMINLATYLGSSQAGLPGALIATTAVVIPSFVIILIIAILFKNILKNKHAQAVLSGIMPCFIGIVFAMGVYMVINNALLSSSGFSVEWRAVAMTAVLFALSALYRKLKGKDISSIPLIIISACMGIVIYSF